MTATLRDWVAVLDGLYDPSWAEDWDSVGLVTGDLDAPVSTALFAIDPTPEVVVEARAAGAALVVAHHPLLFRGVHGVDESRPKGRLLADLVRNGPALLTVHTNADVADPGVSDALAAALGLSDVVPLVATAPGSAVKLVVFVPDGDVEKLVDALAAAGAGAIGDYSRCYWATGGRGSFVPEEGADPAIGDVGQRAEVAEQRVEMIVPTSRVDAVLRALRRAHPYEEPAFDLLPTMLAHGRGHGRVGELATQVPAGDFAELGLRADDEVAQLVEPRLVAFDVGQLRQSAAAVREAVERGVDLLQVEELELRFGCCVHAVVLQGSVTIAETCARTPPTLCATRSAASASHGYSLAQWPASISARPRSAASDAGWCRRSAVT